MSHSELRDLRLKVDDILREIDAVLCDPATGSESNPGILAIKIAAGAHYGVSLREINSSRRSRHVAFSRHMAMYLCRELTGHSYPALGRAFDRDHTSVMYAVERID